MQAARELNAIIESQATDQFLQSRAQSSITDDLKTTSRAFLVRHRVDQYLEAFATDQSCNGEDSQWLVYREISSRMKSCRAYTVGDHPQRNLRE
jgi:hypothetical protein